MDSTLMPAFRLVGAQIKTAKAELGRSRPKGSSMLTSEQKHWRNIAKARLLLAEGKYGVVEALQFDTCANLREIRLSLQSASENALYAQLDWRKAHPSDGRLIEVVRL